MKSFNALLFATDFRVASVEAAEAVGQLAAKLGTLVKLLHVVEPIQHWPGATEMIKCDADETLKRAGQALRQQGLSVEVLPLAIGTPAEEIVRTAQSSSIDLVVVGAGELSRFERYSVGPIAAAVVEYSQPSVLAIRPGGPKLAFRNILCAVDQSPPAAEGVRVAVRLAQAFGGRLTLLSVVPAVTVEVAAAMSGHWSDERKRYESQWHGEFEEFLRETDLSGLEVEKLVRYGRPHEEIIRAARESNTDLIVMGATGRSGLARVLLGSTARRVLEFLPCSLLAVKT